MSLNSAAPVITPPEALAAANVVYVQTFVAELLHNAFPHLTRQQLIVTVDGLFTLNQDLPGFREHLRDFLVQIKVVFYIYLFVFVLFLKIILIIILKIGICW